ncbi:hypothetical protein GIB67_019118 [Kingdonia uniflora]|uniref:Uncharacterized protein n=1 Tax=Kingdonia uniflora TaxID=39325 RepID=A0A7J7MZH4_9MAGN|nr:hypothetical protein GIB67_019118 [Kingdonia uniflora]
MNPSETDMLQDLVQETMRHQIKIPAIGAAPVIGGPAVGTRAVIAPAIGSNSSASKIRAVVVRVCSQLEAHGKMLLKLDDHGKILEQISMSTVGDSTLPLGDTLLLGQYLFSTPEKIVKHKREGGNKKEDGKRKKAEPRTKKGPKKEALTDEQFDHVPPIQLKTLIPKIPKRGLANRVPRKRQAEFPELENIQSTAKNLLYQVGPRKILEVVNDLMVDDDFEVGREVNFNAKSSEYGGDLLEWKKGDEKDNDDEKNVEEIPQSEEEQPQMEESKNGNKKVDNVEKYSEEKESEEGKPQVAEEEDSEQPTVVVYYTRKKTMLVAEVAKTDIVFFNQEEVIGEAYQASTDQTTAVSVEEQILETKESKEEVEQIKDEVFEGKDDDDGISQKIPDPGQVIKQMAVDQTNPVLMESKVDVTLKKRHALNEKEINKRTIKIDCEMNRLHAYLDELLPGVLLESFIQRPIS